MSISLLFGALGLFLLGMWLLTEGLKLAGGKALQHMLGTWTSSRIRGLFAGIVVTAIAQSSSAVTVATIGFVNAQLMTFSQSVWVIFGSNVGTTFTAWLVTVFGLKFNIAAITFPMIGLGAFLRVFSPYQRGRALGMAFAGFGILFMGIDALRDGFAGLAASGDFIGLLEGDGNKLLWGFLIGLVLTVLTQASVAAIAIILTAIASGVAGLEIAAAAVIGANLGTTSTALMASIGATPNAKRLAWAHVLFNIFTGAVAFLLLPLFLLMVNRTGMGDYSYSGLAFLVAIFHSFFNVLGVILMWPLEPYLTRFLLKRFKAPSKGHRAQFLDANIASVPDLAVRALSAQLHELAQLVAGQRLETIVRDGKMAFLTGEQNQVMAEIETYIEQVSQSTLSQKLAGQLTAGLAIRHYLQNCLQVAEQIRSSVVDGPTLSPWVREQLCQWLGDVSDTSTEVYRVDANLAREHWSQHLLSYGELKNRLMAAATSRQVAMAEVDAALQLASLCKRYVEQLLHTLNRFAVLDEEESPKSLESNEQSDTPLEGDEPGAKNVA